MRLSCQLFCCAALLFAAAAVIAQEDRAGQQLPAADEHRPPPNWGFPRPEKWPESSSSSSSIFGGSASRPSIRIPLRLGFTGIGDDQENKSAGRLITVEVTLAETPVVGNGKEMTAEKIAELEKAGKLVSQSRYWVSLVENQRSQLQFAERVPIVMGRTIASGGRGTQEAIALESLGTKLSLLGRIDGESVLVQMELDQTRLVPAPTKPEGEASENVTRPRTATTTFQSTLTIAPGKTVVAGGKETQGEKGKVQTWLLVSARAEGARKEVADAGSQIKIFRLIDAKAESLALSCSKSLPGRTCRLEWMPGPTASLPGETKKLSPFSVESSPRSTKEIWRRRLRRRNRSPNGNTSLLLHQLRPELARSCERQRTA
jgi:hypothetical protein